MRVLIVDDDPNCRQILELMLARQGWSLHLAENGEEGLAMARALTPELVLMDVLMPQMTGLDAVAQMKADPALAATKVFAITALAFEQDRQAALAAGFDVVITKPFSRRQLLEAIQRHFPGLEFADDAAKVPA
jgi:CheY-like chemotaxis protein